MRWIFNVEFEYCMHCYECDLCLFPNAILPDTDRPTFTLYLHTQRNVYCRLHYKCSKQSLKTYLFLNLDFFMVLKGIELLF